MIVYWCCIACFIPNEMISDMQTSTLLPHWCDMKWLLSFKILILHVCLRIFQFKKLILQVCVNRCLQRGAAGSGRSDDNLESLKKRFDTYMNDTMPIIHYYEERNLVKQVAASGTPEEVGNALYLFNIFPHLLWNGHHVH